MSDTELSLGMRIRANGQQALEELRRVNTAVGNLTGGAAGGGMGRGITAGMGAAKGILGGLLVPLRIAGGLFLGAAAGATAFGAMAIRSAAGMETLQGRLEAVMGSAARAAKAFKETQAFAAATPFETDDLVDARIVLEGIGVSGVSALKSAANAAAAMGRNVTDVAAVIASMETEPLRRLGISLARDGEKATIQFRDKMGKMHTVVSEGALEMRQALLGVFDLKFGGATDKLAATYYGLASTLKDSIQLAFGGIGKGLLPAAKSFVKYISDGISELTETGKLEEIGKRIGVYLSESVDNFKAGMATAADFWQYMQTSGMTGIAQTVSSILSAAVKIFMVSWVQSLIATKDIFISLGELLASVFMKKILVLPGMGDTRKSMMMEAFYDATPEQQEKLRQKYGNNFNALSPAQQAEIATSGADDGVSNAARKTMDAIPTFISNVKATIKEELRTAISESAEATGFDFAGRFAANKAALAPPADVLYTMRRNRRDNTGALLEDVMPVTFRAPAGKYSKGQKNARGDVIISIQSMTVRANSTREMENAVLAAAGVPQ